MSEFPDFYISDEGHRVDGPVYELLADCFFDDSLWLAGEHIATDMTPNHHMHPLNKAAAERVEMWLSTLPQAGSNLRVDDLLEAAMMLRPKEGDAELTTADFHSAVVRLAGQIKAKREGGQGLTLPPVVQSASGIKNAPPMPNANIESRRGHDFAEHRVNHHPQKPDRKVRRPKDAMGSLPPQQSMQRAS